MLQSLQRKMVDSSFDCRLRVVPLALLKFTFSSVAKVASIHVIQPGLAGSRSRMGFSRTRKTEMITVFNLVQTETPESQGRKSRKQQSM